MSLQAALDKIAKFVKAREFAWKHVHPDSALYGQKYPDANLTIGDFRALASAADGFEHPLDVELRKWINCDIDDETMWILVKRHLKIEENMDVV